MANEPDRNETVEAYKEKTPTSHKLYKQAINSLPGAIGGSAPSYDPYPLFLKNGKGAKVWDEDNQAYLDFNLCWGVLFVGHCHPKLVEGLKTQIEHGTMYGLPHREIIDVANALKQRFPIEQLRFTNSGTESTLYAIRLARRYTGKDKIVKIEGSYHGIADPLHVSKRPSAGEMGPYQRPSQIPYGKGMAKGGWKDTIVAPFNDIDVMEEILHQHLGEIAAVIVEPVMMNAGVIPPKESYLRKLRKRTKNLNVLLIFDEVKTGVKLAPGGAADYFDIEPDLISLAKAIGGGLPIGACGGKKAIMEEIDHEGLFGTFSANPLAIRASKITLNEILTNENYEKVAKLGKTLQASYQDIIEDHDIEAVVQGIRAIGGPLFTGKPVQNYRDWLAVDKEKFHEYWLKMVNKGVIPMAYGPEEEWLVSVQHTEEHIQTHIETFKEVAPTL